MDTIIGTFIDIIFLRKSWCVLAPAWRPDSAFLPVYGRSGLSVIERNDKGCLATSVIGHVAATVGCLGLVWSVEDALKGDLLPTTIIGIICLVYL